VTPSETEATVDWTLTRVLLTGRPWSEITLPASVALEAVPRLYKHAAINTIMRNNLGTIASRRKHIKSMSADATGFSAFCQAQIYFTCGSFLC
jgi:hypothetical protein